MISSGWFVVFVFAFGALAYRRASLILYTAVFFVILATSTWLHGASIGITLSWILYALVFAPLNVKFWRQRFITRPLYTFFKKQMPTMSKTEKDAISAGTVTWEADIFAGNPDWNKLLSLPTAKLSAEEQAFLDGPVEKLCEMISDWDITHNLADMPPEMWQFLKDEGFFALMIPKKFGGKEFSAFAHSQVIIKVSGRSITASTTISVPNSLGPAELLLHYGTEEQKNYYLPRLAKGIDVPCFALTSPDAGSDAGAMMDHGIVCEGVYDGRKTLGIRLNWNKRYITLAPVATVIGLAFKLYDPEHLLGNVEDIGITCALIPRDTKGVTIGRRHFPLNTPFQNGPTQGKDVFVPIDFIIGGAAQAGNGWRMLMECLAAGRAITLPASAIGGAKVLSYATGAYARIRKQFNLPISRFEGIEEPLARIGAYTYLADAARILAVSSVDQGEKPSVASAIVKYHTTELGRMIALDGMDIHGGKAICLGPNNYLGRGFESSPIAITVEGANILTRNLIIFGQGAIRCHPYVLPEIDAVQMTDTKAGFAKFDKLIMGHIGFAISNIARSFILGITGSKIVMPPKSKVAHYYRDATRFSSAFALLADTSMLVLGSNLKRKESLSAKLGDILSYLYMVSAVLKHYHNQGETIDDLPVVQFACDYCFAQIQDRFDSILKNFPNRPIALVLRALIFPLGQHFSKPSDHLHHQVAELLAAPTNTRSRISTGIYLGARGNNAMADLQDALVKTIATDPIEKIITTAVKNGDALGFTLKEQAQSALSNNLITTEQFNLFIQAEDARKKVLAVDDFSSAELARITTESITQDYYVDPASNSM